MEYRRVGKSGVKISEFSLGSWITFGRQVEGSDAVSLMARAYDSASILDNAERYESGKSEIVMGETLKTLGWSRDSFIVYSKVFRGGQKPTQPGVYRASKSPTPPTRPKAPQVVYLDLYFCHRADIDTPIEETVRAMPDLVSQGKIL